MTVRRNTEATKDTRIYRSIRSELMDLNFTVSITKTKCMLLKSMNYSDVYKRKIKMHTKLLDEKSG